MGSETAVLVLVLYAVVIVASITAGVFYLLTLQRALRLCAPQNRLMEPGSVWLCLIPLFNFVWIFFTVSRVAKSLQQEFESRQAPQEDYGRGVGLSYCILAVISIIPFVGVITGLAGMVCWILFWVRISSLSRTLEFGATPEETPQDEERYDLGKAWVALLILVVALAAQHLQAIVFSWYAHKLTAQWQLTSANIGIAISSYLFGMMAGYLLMTIVTALCGTRWGLVVALIGVTLAAAGSGLVSSLGGLVVQRAALGVFAGGAFPAAIQSIREFFPSTLRPLAVGILLASFSLLSLLLLLVQPHVTAAMGWQTASMLTGIPAAIAAALCWILWKPRPPYVSTGVTSFGIVSVVMLAVGFLLLTPVYTYAQTWLPMLSMREFGMRSFYWNFNMAATLAGALVAGGAAWAMVKVGMNAWKTRATLLTILGALLPLAALAGIFLIPVATEGGMSMLQSNPIVPSLTSAAMMAAFQGCSVILLVAVADSLPARGVCIGVAIGEFISTVMMMASNAVIGAAVNQYGTKFSAAATAVLAACGVICIILLAWLVRPRQAQPSQSIPSAA